MWCVFVNYPKRKYICNYLLQMFKYDKHSSDLVLRKGFKYACDVPKRVSNIVNASTRKAMC